MKPLLITLGLLGLLIAATQVLRHVCVLWIPPAASFLDKFDDKTDKDGAASLSFAELTKKYDDIRREIQVKDAGKTEDERNKVNIWEEPYKTENKLRTAIQVWESRSREVAEVHFFWWCGLGCVVFGMAGFAIAAFLPDGAGTPMRWLAVAALATGFIEMLYWTSPAVRLLGGVLEFEQLLIWKLIYTAATLGLLAGSWLCLNLLIRSSGQAKV